MALVLRLRHSYSAPSRLVTIAFCTWRWCLCYGTATVRLRAWCLQLTPRGNYALDTAQLHLTFDLWLRHSYGAPSRLVSTGYCTWRWCLSYGTATVRFRAWCLQLTPPGVGAWATAQLRFAFAFVGFCLLHLALVLELCHSYGTHSRDLTAVYCT